MNTLIGRENEIRRLHIRYNSSKAEFMAVYGRRRVGKTFLVKSLYESEFTFYTTGLAKGGLSIQLRQFDKAIIKYGQENLDLGPSTDWFVAFDNLMQLIQHASSTEKKIIFLDELPWFDTRNSNFLVALEYFWNNWASARNDIFLIVCGSSASWMLDEVIYGKGGLHNRVTDSIRIEPFSLYETELFLKSKNVQMDRYQIMLVYMALGGIPYYLDSIRSGMSATQNINTLCFERSAPLRREFQSIYASLFNKHDRHISIIRALSSRGKGLSRTEIASKSGLSQGGGLTRLLRELEESNFIRKYRAFGQKERDSKYQLIDLFSLFHLRFIEASSSDDHNFWINLHESPTYYSWAGYAYEMVSLQHIAQIKQALGIYGIQSTVSQWSSKDAQIDLLIDRKDQVVNICEMKFSLTKFRIDKRYSEKLRKKSDTFRQATRTSKALFLTMITTYGVEQNQYAGTIQNDLNMDMLFREIM